jgi:protein-tyrosine phosphatase
MTMQLRFLMIRAMSHVAVMRLKSQTLDPKSFIMRPTSDMRDDHLLEFPLQGSLNFRDIGGYRTRDGRTVKYGRVYRSGDLTSMTETDLDYLLNTLRIKTVCDLRNAEEIDASPRRFPEGAIRYLHLPVLRSAASQEDGRMARALFSGDMDKIDDAFGRTYTMMIDTAGESFGQALKALANPANLPAITHCTAGKDRTGVTVALLLALLGVPDPAIIADYSLTNLAHDRVFASATRNKSFSATGLLPQMLAPILIAKPQWIDRTLRHVRHVYGSVEHYVTAVGGVTQDEIAALKANLLE